MEAWTCKWCVVWKAPGWQFLGRIYDPADISDPLGRNELAARGAENLLSSTAPFRRSDARGHRRVIAVPKIGVS